MSEGTAFSPSRVHHALRDRMPQAFSFDGGNVAAWQGRLRPQLARRLGAMPDARPPLQPRTLWRRPCEDGIIEKVVFACEDGADAPAYVCIPKEATPPLPFAICLQGHSSGMHNSIAVDRDDETKPIDVEGDRDFGLGCMRRGVGALCLEQRAFGERRERDQANVCAHSGCHDAAMHALHLGRTLVGERVYDVDRAIDYLLTRPEVDPARIGVLGNSGGGTVSVFAAALLDRLAFAMPSCYFCTFRESILSLYHCMCNYVPGLQQDAEMADIVGLFAPKPVVVVAGRKDPIFPFDATKREFERLLDIYRAAGAENRCRLVVGEGGHRFYADDAWPVLLQLLADTPASSPEHGREPAP